MKTTVDLPNDATRQAVRHAATETEPKAITGRRRTRRPMQVGRNSTGIEVDPQYCQSAMQRLWNDSQTLLTHATLEFRTAPSEKDEAFVAHDKPAKRRSKSDEDSIGS